MNSRQHSQRNSSQNNLSSRMFDPRPHQIPISRNVTSQPNLNNALTQAQRYGRRLNDTSEEVETQQQLPLQAKNQEEQQDWLLEATQGASKQTTDLKIASPMRKPPQPNSQNELGQTGVIQRAAVRFNRKNKRYTSGSRPNFPKRYHAFYRDNFNKIRPPKINILKVRDNLKKLGYSRNHRVSYKDINTSVQNFLNGNTNQAQFLKSTNALYNKDKAGNYAGFGYQRMNKLRLKMLNAKTPEDKAKYASSMTTHLNASKLNVTIGKDKANQTIGEHFDPNFALTPKGKHFSMTPKTQHVLNGFGHSNISKPMLSPGGNSVLSSHIFHPAGQSGLVPLKALTPNSQQSMHQLMTQGMGNFGNISKANLPNFPRL